ncbi:MAG: glycosyltransferase family 9 protein [Acidimicrobiales bacterium]
MGAADGPPVVIHLGASSAARRWPTDRWAAVAGALRGDGHRILLTGDRSDRPAADHVAAAASLPPEAVLTGRTAPAELIAGVAHAALVLVGDTGVAHLASAYGSPIGGAVRPGVPGAVGATARPAPGAVGRAAR